LSEIVRIPFQGDEILTVDHDGKPFVILKTAFDAIGLDADQQIRKLKRQAWATTAVTTVVAADGRSRDMVTADVRTFLMALATIPASRVAGEVRPKLEAYQAEVADAIEAYWTKGGALNPRATDDQLDTIIRHAQGQMRVLQLAEGLIDAKWLEAKARHVTARALGEEPEIPADQRPLSTSEYLDDKGMSAAEQRSFASTFGKRVKALYVAAHGQEPPIAERFVGGALRKVKSYTEADRPVMDEAFEQLTGVLV
jgi:hypothetical protein